MSNKKIIKLTETEIPKTPLAFFWYVSKPFKWWMFSAIAFVVLAATLGQGSAYFFKLIVDAIEAGNSKYVFWLALLYPILIFLEQVLYRVSGLLGRNWTTNAEKRGTDVLSNYVFGHSHVFFIDRFAGSLLSKVSNVTGALNQLIPDFLWNYLTAATSLTVTLIFLIFIDIKTAIVFLALIIVLFFVNRKLARQKEIFSKKTAESRTAVRARLVDVFSNIQAVRQYVQTPNEESSVHNLSEELREATSESWGYSEKLTIINSTVLFLFSMVMFWILVQGWRLGEVSTGDLIFMLVLYSQVVGTLSFIGRMFNRAAQTVGEMREGLEDLLLPYDIVDTRDAQPLLVDKASINWKHVEFKFDEQQVFSDFNLDILAGQRLGLVGKSGAGKSTFVSLLLRQHDISSGTIEIDGQDISKVTQDSLRQAIAVVPQEPALFHRTIKENILYGKSDATDEEIIEVAKKAQAHDFIITLPKGYDTMVGERGVKLSGGQKQRIAIARAMLKNAPILILDEATSALDSESEVAIQKALHELMEGKTVIAVAHRLSTLREMDRIIVMEEGKIIEDGTHDDLANAGGTYERLWNHQAGGFMQD